MIVAVFSRELRPGVDVNELVQAWRPEDRNSYPADVTVGIDPTNDRKVLTIISFDGDMSQFEQAMPRLVHPQSLERLRPLVESTDLEAIYEIIDVGL